MIVSIINQASGARMDTAPQRTACAQTLSGGRPKAQIGRFPRTPGAGSASPAGFRMSKCSIRSAHPS